MALTLAVTVSPGAKRSRILGRHGEGWKASVTAAPERGRANEALVSLLAEALDVPERGIRVVAGHASRRKTLTVEGVDPGEAGRRLEAAARRSS